MSETLSEADMDTIKEALDQGGKIKAIKLYRECTGCDLASAKSAVERIAAGVSPVDVGEGASEWGEFAPSDEDVAAISAALSEGRKVEAVGILRDRSGMGLKEAKAAIDGLEVKLGLKGDPTTQGKKGGCMLVIATVALLAAGASWAAVL